MKYEIYIFAILLIIFSQQAVSQVIRKEFLPNDTINFELLRAEFGQNKTIPKEFEKQILLALSFYPELRNTKIVFKVKKTLIPLSSRPTFWSVFKRRKNRTYKISISSKTIAFLTPILLKNLSYNAQIGVLGHEIAHIAEYINKNAWQIIGMGFGQLSGKYIDKFEYATDMRCIEHGLGYQLLAWSVQVREKLQVKEWKNVSAKSSSERYMNPETIEKYIREQTKVYSTKSNLTK
jgi:predicted SprT family Zn-dependent metalloprotease